MYTPYTFQMSVRTEILNRLRWFVLFVMDTWINLQTWLNKRRTLQAQARAVAETSKLMACTLIAATTDRNITPIMLAFYEQELISCFRLQKYLQACGATSSAVTIYTMRDCQIRKSVIDLECNLEMLTRSDIDDMSIDALPSVVMSCEEITTQQ
jgi:hypothetical protein